MSLALPGEKANKIVEHCLEAFFEQESWRWGLLHDYSAAYPRAFRQFFGTAVLSKEKPRSSLVSPICTYRKMSSKGSCIRGHSSSDRPCVENAILVPTSVRTHRENSSRIGVSEVVSRPISSNVENLAVSRMEAIRQSLSARGISQQVSSVILSSWRHGTNAQFNSAWNRWSRWWVQRQVKPVRAPLPDILGFLHSLFQQGLQYRTINVYRSAISSAHVPVEGAPVGHQSPPLQGFTGEMLQHREFQTAVLASVKRWNIQGESDD